MNIEAIRAGLACVLLLCSPLMVRGQIYLAGADDANQAAAAGVDLAWDASPDANVVGYNLYYGTADGNWTNQLDVGNQTSATLAGCQPGVTYYFTVKAYNSSGVESQPSPELQYLAPSVLSQMLQIASPLISGNTFQLNFQGIAGVSYRIEAAEDLKNWTEVLTTNLAVTGPLELTITDLGAYPKRFFRIAQY